ncbi:MAG: hypothetical protein R3E97_21200 [Candidatus Eisenbacteria bacterium]
MFRMWRILWLIALGLCIHDLVPTAPPAVAQPTSSTSRGESLGDPTTPELLEIHWADLLPDGSPVPITSGRTVRVETVWNRGGLTITADASAVAETLAAVPLTVSDFADSIYVLELFADATPVAGLKAVPLRVTAADLPDTVTIDGLEVCVQNDPPRFTGLTVTSPHTSFRPNDVLRFESSWIVTSPPGELAVDLRSIDPSLDGLVMADVLEGGDTSNFHLFGLTYRIPSFAADRAGDYVVPIFCTGQACGGTVDSSLVVTLSAERSVPPVLVDWEVLAPLDGTGEPRSLVNGDTIRLLTYWDRDSLLVSGDPFSIAPTDTGRPSTIQRGPGEYEIVYTVPPDNPRQDGADLAFVLLAEDLDGLSTMDSSVRFCLSNSHPVHVETTIDPIRRTFRALDVFTVTSVWLSNSRLPLSVELDLERVAPGATRLVQAPQGQGDSLYTAIFEYTLPGRDRLGPDGEGLPLPVICREVGGCDSVRLERPVTIGIDTTPPDTTGPVLDLLPAQTSADSILVSGTTAPEATRAGLTRQGSTVRYADVDPITGRFESYIKLIHDTENAIRAFAEDSLLNRTRSSDPQYVQQVSAFHIEFDRPFLRGGEIRVGDPDGIRDLRLALYDLEGRLVMNWSAPEFSLTHAWEWDGSDLDGDPVRQGYYIVRAEYTHTNGRKAEKSAGLVLGD